MNKVQRIVINPESRTIQFWYSQAPFCREVSDNLYGRVMRYIARNQATWQLPVNFRRVTIYERKTTV